MYSTYAITLYSSLLLPRQVGRFFLHNASMQFTCSFSNNPGPLKFQEFDDEFGNKGIMRYCYPYVIVGGRTGMCISCISYGPNFQIAITCDEAICAAPEDIICLMEKNLLCEINTKKTD